MKFPYGLCDFHDLILEDYVYIDRTQHIPLLEQAGRQLLFLRPRRFGKSLLLSMLENYYDLNKADKFTALFGKLAIGQNPTPLHHQYFVMKWDFSAISPAGDIEQVQQNIRDYINVQINSFQSYYADYLTHPININPTNAQVSFQSLVSAVKQTSHRLYLLIDEYDNFANELMMGKRIDSESQQYQTLLQGEGALKALFKVIKAAAAGEGLERVFITGVSPVVMADMTSGYNVSESIYLEAEFNELCGFTDTEISQLVQKIADECGLPSEKATEALELMRTFYNGYRFCYESNELIHNPTLALYFLKRFQRQCEYPEELLDSNLAMDRGKIAYIAHIPHGNQLILDALSETGEIRINKLFKKFGLNDMLYAVKDSQFMASFLYYFGVLTFGGRTPFGEHQLKIPNLVIRELYAERIREFFVPKGVETYELTKNLYAYGNMKPVCEFVEQYYFPVFSNRDYRWSNELTVKTIFLSLLFNDSFYIMDSEAEMDKGYADLTMILRPDKRQFQLKDILIEFKYLSLKDLDLTGEELKAKTPEQLQALPQVQNKLTEAEKRLQDYSQSLQNKYQDILRLQSFAVCALGTERLVFSVLKS